MPRWLSRWIPWWLPRWVPCISIWPGKYPGGCPGGYPSSSQCGCSVYLDCYTHCLYWLCASGSSTPGGYCIKRSPVRAMIDSNGRSLGIRERRLCTMGMSHSHDSTSSSRYRTIYVINTIYVIKYRTIYVIKYSTSSSRYRTIYVINTIYVIKYTTIYVIK